MAPISGRIYLFSAAQLGFAKIAHALLLRMIFSKIIRAGFIWSIEAEKQSDPRRDFAGACMRSSTASFS
jgi:hypothetical protein